MISVIYILNGLALGMLLALTASGLSLIFGFMKIVNFAHGALYMLGAYFALFIIGKLDNFWLALLISPLIVAIVGVIVERGLLCKIVNRGEMDSVLLTFGLALLIENVVKMIWGSGNFTYNPPELLSGTIKVFGYSYPSYRIFVIIFSALICFLLYLILHKTILGVRVRAGTEDGEMASVLGINTMILGTFVFAIGCALAAVAGVISGPFLSLSPSMGASIIITTFIVVVIGGMGKLLNTIVSAVFVGFIQSFGSIVMPDFMMVLVYIVMILVLLNNNGVSRMFRAKLSPKKMLTKEG